MTHSFIVALFVSSLSLKKEACSFMTLLIVEPNDYCNESCAHSDHRAIDGQLKRQKTSWVLDAMVVLVNPPTGKPPLLLAM